MKNKLKLSSFFAMLFLAFSLTAQDAQLTASAIETQFNTSDYRLNSTKRLARKYRAIVLGLGTRGISSDPGTIVTSFTDDSPAPDFFEATEEIDDHQERLGVQFGYHFGFYRGISHSILFDLAFGNTEGVALGYSLGYNIPLEVGKSHLHVRPNVTAFIGNTRILLGKIQNGTGYIQVNETQFYEQEVKVKLNTSSYVFRVGGDFLYDITERINLFANVGYDFGGQVGDPDLYFESPASSDDQQTADKPLSGDNPNVSYNGEKVTELPFELGGLRLTIGAAFVWTKD